MTKLITALKRTLQPHAEADVHFHRGPHNARPEVCHEHACERPRLG
jgi:hypothetical protein